MLNYGVNAAGLSADLWGILGLERSFRVALDTARVGTSAPSTSPSLDEIMWGAYIKRAGGIFEV